MLQRIYLDSSAVIELATAKTVAGKSCAQIVGDASVIIASQLVLLETVAPCAGAKKWLRRERILKVLESVTEWVDVTPEVVALAIEISSNKYGLSAADAIHLAICQEYDAVFLNAEGPDRAPNQVAGVKSHTIYQKSP